MRPDKAVLRETGRLAVVILIMVLVMLGVYAVIGRFGAPVALGGLYTGALTVANFFFMGLTVQGITDRAAEKQRDEDELAAFSRDMENLMKLSRTLRMAALFGLIVLGITVFGFDPLATILPIVFPTLAIRVLQILDVKFPGSKGREKP